MRPGPRAERHAGGGGGGGRAGAASTEQPAHQLAAWSLPRGGAWAGVRPPRPQLGAAGSRREALSGHVLPSFPAPAPRKGAPIRALPQTPLRPAARAPRAAGTATRPQPWIRSTGRRRRRTASGGRSTVPASSRTAPGPPSARCSWTEGALPRARRGTRRRCWPSGARGGAAARARAGTTAHTPASPARCSRARPRRCAGRCAGRPPSRAPRTRRAGRHAHAQRAGAPTPPQGYARPHGQADGGAVDADGQRGRRAGEPEPAGARRQGLAACGLPARRPVPAKPCTAAPGARRTNTPAAPRPPSRARRPADRCVSVACGDARRPHRHVPGKRGVRDVVPGAAARRPAGGARARRGGAQPRDRGGRCQGLLPLPLPQTRPALPAVALPGARCGRPGVLRAQLCRIRRRLRWRCQRRGRGAAGTEARNALSGQVRRWRPWRSRCKERRMPSAIAGSASSSAPTRASHAPAPHPRLLQARRCRPRVGVRHHPV
jgi:hypothetical protein